MIFVPASIRTFSFASESLQKPSSTSFGTSCADAVATIVISANEVKFGTISSSFNAHVCYVIYFDHVDVALALRISNILYFKTNLSPFCRNLRQFFNNSFLKFNNMRIITI